MNQKTCMSFSLYFLGDKLLEDHLSSYEDLNMDLVYTVIDNYRHAMTLTRGKEVSFFLFSSKRVMKNDFVRAGI